MTEPTTFVDMVQAVGRSTVMALAAWGMAGGATAALVARANLRETFRLILLGGLIAAGAGTIATSLLVAMFNLPPEAIPAGTAVGSGAYLMGVFGGAWIEVMLARLRAGRLPGEGRPDGQH